MQGEAVEDSAGKAVCQAGEQVQPGRRRTRAAAAQRRAAQPEAAGSLDCQRGALPAQLRQATCYFDKVNNHDWLMLLLCASAVQDKCPNCTTCEVFLLNHHAVKLLKSQAAWIAKQVHCLHKTCNLKRHVKVIYDEQVAAMGQCRYGVYVGSLLVANTHMYLLDHNAHKLRFMPGRVAKAMQFMPAVLHSMCRWRSCSWQYFAD